MTTIRYSHLSMIHTLLAVIKKYIFSNNSEANASELLENLVEMFMWYYIYQRTDMLRMFNYSTTRRCVTRRERVQNL